MSCGAEPYNPAGGKPRTPGRVGFSRQGPAGIPKRSERSVRIIRISSRERFAPPPPGPAGTASQACRRGGFLSNATRGRPDVILGTPVAPWRRDRSATTCDRTGARDGTAKNVTLGGDRTRATVNRRPGWSTVDEPAATVSTVDSGRPRWAVRPSLVHPGAGITLLATQRSFCGDTPYYASSSSRYLSAIFWRGCHAACGWKSLVTLPRESPITCRVKPPRALRDHQ